MANWYYFSDNGRKIGPLSDRTFKNLIQEGKIRRNTIVANQYGRTVQAGSILGLPFPQDDEDGSPLSGIAPNAGEPFADPSAGLSLGQPIPSATPLEIIEGLDNKTGGRESSGRGWILLVTLIFLVGVLVIAAFMVVHNRNAKNSAADDQQEEVQNEEEPSEDASALPDGESETAEEAPASQEEAPAPQGPSLPELKAERDELQTALEDTEQWLEEYGVYAEQAAMVEKDPSALERLTEPKSRLWDVSYDVGMMGEQMRRQRETLRARVSELDERIKNAP